jgi:hypothetical protein
MIGCMNTKIAAHALAEGLILVTNNADDFRHVDGLVLENRRLGNVPWADRAWVHSFRHALVKRPRLPPMNRVFRTIATLPREKHWCVRSLISLKPDGGGHRLSVVLWLRHLTARPRGTAPDSMAMTGEGRRGWLQGRWAGPQGPAFGRNVSTDRPPTASPSLPRGRTNACGIGVGTAFRKSTDMYTVPRLRPRLRTVPRLLSPALAVPES